MGGGSSGAVPPSSFGLLSTHEHGNAQDDGSGGQGTGHARPAPPLDASCFAPPHGVVFTVLVDLFGFTSCGRGGLRPLPTDGGPARARAPAGLLHLAPSPPRFVQLTDFVVDTVYWLTSGRGGPRAGPPRLTGGPARVSGPPNQAGGTELRPRGGASLPFAMARWAAHLVLLLATPLDFLFCVLCVFGPALVSSCLPSFFLDSMLRSFNSDFTHHYATNVHYAINNPGVGCFGGTTTEDGLSPALRALLVGPFASTSFEASLVALKLEEVSKFKVYDDVEDLLDDRRAADVPFDEGLIRRFWALARRSPDSTAQEQAWRRSRMPFQHGQPSLGSYTSPLPRPAPLPTPPSPPPAAARAVAGRGTRGSWGAYASTPVPPARQPQPTLAEVRHGGPLKAAYVAGTGPPASRHSSSAPWPLPPPRTARLSQPHAITQGATSADTLRSQEAAKHHHWSQTLLAHVALAGPAATINA